MITLRLDSELEKRLNSIAEVLGISKSELVRKSLLAYLDQVVRSCAWDLGRDLFGKYSSGRTDLSVNRKSILRQKLRDRKDGKGSH